MMGIDSEGMLISAVHEKDGGEALNLLIVDDRIPAGAKLYWKPGGEYIFHQIIHDVGQR